MNNYIKVEKIIETIKILKKKQKQVKKLKIDFIDWLYIGQIGILESIIEENDIKSELEENENHIPRID